MPTLDPNNPTVDPVVPINPEFLAAQQKLAQASADGALAAKQLALAISAGDVPVDERGIYLSILLACLGNPQIATSSSNVQVWATDLTKDYLLKYPLPIVAP